MLESTRRASRPLLRLALALLVGAPALGALPLPLAAQATGTIRGRVVEAPTGRAIRDVQVLVAGTRLGAVTDGAGQYTIANVPAGAVTLETRRLGFSPASQRITLAAGETATADFALQTAALELSAVVVTGTAGGAEKRTLGNAVTQLDAAELVEKSSLQNVTDLLQSKSPGVTLVPGSGTSGTRADIRIRGAGSFNTVGPVFYVDGVRYGSDSRGNYNPSGSGTGGVFSQGTSVLDLLSPEDIESIEVIKGPAAATLYGTDAAGGVIQIITKKGTRGQQALRWNVKAETGQNEWTLKKPTNYTTCDAAKIAATQPDGSPTWPGCQGQPVGTVLQDSPLERDPDALRTGDLTSLSLSARGGGDRYSFYVSGDLDREQGVFYNNYNNRRSGRANLTVTPTDALDFAFTLNVAQSHLRLPLGDDAAGGFVLSAVRGQPGRVYNWEPGYLILGPELANTYDNQARTTRFIVGSTVNYTPLPWLRNRLTAGIDYASGLANIFYAPDARAPLGIAIGLTAQKEPINALYTIDYAGTAAFDLGADWTSESSVGVQLSAEQSRITEAVGEGLGSPVTRSISSAATVRASSFYQDQNQLGYYLQQQVGWRDRLFATGAVRIDNNSAFGDDVSQAAYPKAMLSYVVSEEPALAPWIAAARIDDLKLRAAWGQAGKAPGPFAAARTYVIDKVTLPTGATGSALRTGVPGNPDLEPERGDEYEVGFDASFLENRLGVEFTYYDKTMRDALVEVPFPPSSGFSGTQTQNLAEITNSGIELGLSGTPVQTRRVSWDSRLTLSTNRNELVKFGFERSPILFGIYFNGSQRHVEGKPLAGYWGFDPQRDAEGNLVLNGAGTNVLVESEARYIGPSVPTREAGFSNTVTLFGSVRLYALLDYKGGNYQFNVKDWVRSNSVQNTGPLNDPNVSDSTKAWLRTRGATAQWIQPADFLKLRDVSISYQLPASLTGRVGAGPASLTLAAHNVSILWTRYGGADPEVNFYGRQSFERADSYTTPMVRRVTAAINVAF